MRVVQGPPRGLPRDREGEPSRASPPVLSKHPTRYLIEIFLPVADNAGTAFDEAKCVTVREALTAQFGGVTIFSRAPAHGVTKDGGKQVHDEIVVVEVMTDEFERSWWRDYRAALEREFKQDEILIRATVIEKI